MNVIICDNFLATSQAVSIVDVKCTNTKSFRATWAHSGHWCPVP